MQKHAGTCHYHTKHTHGTHDLEATAVAARQPVHLLHKHAPSTPLIIRPDQTPLINRPDHTTCAPCISHHFNVRVQTSTALLSGAVFTVTSTCSNVEPGKLLISGCGMLQLTTHQTAGIADMFVHACCPLTPLLHLPGCG
jgi:hypothetical protein